jgi:hypothetical protein
MIVGNLIGLVMLFVASVAWALVTRIVGHAHSGALQLAVAAVMLLALDLGYRQFRESTLFGRVGGRLFFVPAWLFGVVLGIVGVVTFVRH